MPYVGLWYSCGPYFWYLLYVLNFTICSESGGGGNGDGDGVSDNDDGGCDDDGDGNGVGSVGNGDGDGNGDSVSSIPALCMVSVLSSVLVTISLMSYAGVY